MESAESFVDGLLAGEGGSIKRARYMAEVTARDAAIRAESAALLKMCGEALKAVATFREQYQGIEYFAPGIGCGIEDRCLDRYHAAEYGWDKAMEKVGDCLPEDNVINTALAALKEAGVVECLIREPEPRVHCGCCGKWIPNEVDISGTGWGLCEECSNIKEQPHV